MTIAEYGAKIAHLQTEVKGLLDKHGDSMTADAFAELQARETELKGLVADRDRAREVERIASEAKAFDEREGIVSRLPAPKVIAGDSEVKSIGELFTDSIAYKNRGSVASFGDVDVKASFLTSAGWAPAPVRSDMVQLSPQRPLTLLDYLPSMEVGVGVTGYRYMQETTFTNGAAEIAEAGTYAEATLALTEATADIRKVGVLLPVSDEQLADVAGIREYLNSRLAYMVRQRLETQVVSGNGTAPNIKGLLNVSGILTQAKGSDNTYDAIYKAITKIRVSGFAEPSVIVMHPTDWQNARILQTTGGAYILDNPRADVAPTLFGIPVVITVAVSAGTALVFDASFLSVLYNRGLETQITNSHASSFASGMQYIRADVRAGVGLFRAPALCQVTGL